MFFGPNCGVGALGKVTKAQKKALAAKKKAAKEVKTLTKTLAKLEKKEAKVAKRLAAIRAKAGMAVAAGATPQAAAQAALVADAQANPGEPLVASPAQAPALMAASQPYYAAQAAAEPPAMSEAEAVEELSPDPSAEDIGESEMVDVEDASDVNTQEAAAEVEAQGAMTPYPGQTIPTVTGDAERADWQESAPSARRHGFFGMGAVAAAKVVAQQAAKKAVAKGATPTKAAKVAAKVARRFFAECRGRGPGFFFFKSSKR